MTRGIPAPPWRYLENNIIEKLCGRCELWINLELFHKSSSTKDGLHCWCNLCQREYRRERRKNDPSYRENLLQRDRELRKSLIIAYGGKCIKCGFDDFRALQIDHINGGGTKERNKQHWRKFYKYLLQNIDKRKYQILCANCNWIKRHENKEYTNFQAVQKGAEKLGNMRLKDYSEEVV